MSTAKLTLIGLYNWNSSLFDNLKVPAYVDKNVLVDNILLRSGDFEVLYSDFNFLKYAIGIWSDKWYRTFTKWSEALQIEYDPLYNYDRTEEWTTDENVADAGTHSESDKSNSTHAENNNSNSTHTENDMSTGSDNSETLTDSTSTDKVSAYNDNTLVNDKQNTLSSEGNTSSVTRMESERSGSDVNNQNVSGTNTNIRDISGSNTNSRDRSETRKGHAYGNIGVTTSQQMLQSELDIAAWNLYEHITDIFLQEFVIPVF